MSINNIYKYILLSVFILWIGISTIRYVYNIVKIVLDTSFINQYSQTQKQEKLFGSAYFLEEKIKKLSSPSKPILVISQNKDIYFFLRYYLYPQKVYSLSSFDKKETSSIEKYETIIFFHTKSNTSIQKNYICKKTSDGQGEVCIKK